MDLKWGVTGRIPGTEGVQNGVSSDIYEGEIQAKRLWVRRGKKGREGKKGKMRKKKRMRDSLDPGGSGLSHFEGDFLKF